MNRLMRAAIAVVAFAAVAAIGLGLFAMILIQLGMCGSGCPTGPERTGLLGALVTVGLGGLASGILAPVLIMKKRALFAFGFTLLWFIAIPVFGYLSGAVHQLAALTRPAAPVQKAEEGAVFTPLPREGAAVPVAPVSAPSAQTPNLEPPSQDAKKFAYTLPGQNTVYTDGITPLAEVNAQGMAYIVADAVRVRSAPSDTAPIVAMLRRDQRVAILGTKPLPAGSEWREIIAIEQQSPEVEERALMQTRGYILERFLGDSVNGPDLTPSEIAGLSLPERLTIAERLYAKTPSPERALALAELLDEAGDTDRAQNIRLLAHHRDGQTLAYCHNGQMIFLTGGPYDAPSWRANPSSDAAGIALEVKRHALQAFPWFVPVPANADLSFVPATGRVSWPWRSAIVLVNGADGALEDGKDHYTLDAGAGCRGATASPFYATTPLRQVSLERVEADAPSLQHSARAKAWSMLPGRTKPLETWSDYTMRRHRFYRIGSLDRYRLVIANPVERAALDFVTIVDLKTAEPIYSVGGIFQGEEFVRKIHAVEKAATGEVYILVVVSNQMDGPGRGDRLEIIILEEQGAHLAEDIRLTTEGYEGGAPHQYPL